VKDNDIRCDGNPRDAVHVVDPRQLSSHTIVSNEQQLASSATIAAPDRSRRRPPSLHPLNTPPAKPTNPTTTNMATHSIGFPSELDTHDTAPPPLPRWLKGFLVTSKCNHDTRRAGEEVCELLNDFWFQVRAPPFPRRFPRRTRDSRAPLTAARSAARSSGVLSGSGSFPDRF